MRGQIDHVVLWVKDAGAALRFYVDVVGFEAVRADEFLAGQAPFPSVRVSDSALLDLAPAMAAPLAQGFTGEKLPTAAGQPINHVCLALERADFEALAARLSAAGIAMHKAGDRNFGARGIATRFFYFQDPDGNVVEARSYDV